MALPVVLIALGALLLAVNYGLLDLGFLLGVAQYWPLFVIAAGLDLLWRGRYRLALYGGAAALAIVLSLAGGSVGLGAGGAVEVAQGLEGARRAEVTLDTGVTDLRVAATASDLLASGSLTTGRGEQIRQSFDVRGDTARLTLAARNRSAFPISVGRGGRWDLRLTDRVPLALRIDAGVGRTDLDLRGLRLESLDVNAGVGDVTVTLPSAGAYAVEIDGGVGEVLVRLPRAVEARVTIDEGIGGVNLPAGFARDGNVHTSAGFATAAVRAEIDIDGGVGGVRLERID
jgi:hypothetical protein